MVNITTQEIKIRTDIPKVFDNEVFYDSEQDKDLPCSKTMLIFYYDSGYETETFTKGCYVPSLEMWFDDGTFHIDKVLGWVDLTDNMKQL